MVPSPRFCDFILIFLKNRKRMEILKIIRNDLRQSKVSKEIGNMELKTLKAGSTASLFDYRDHR